MSAEDDCAEYPPDRPSIFMDPEAIARAEKICSICSEVSFTLISRKKKCFGCLLKKKMLRRFLGMVITTSHSKDEASQLFKR